MIDTSSNTKRLWGIGLLSVVIAGVVLFMFRQSPKPQADPRYYSGPMLNKAGTAYVTEDGRIVSPPPGSLSPRAQAAGGRGPGPGKPKLD